MRIVVMNAHLPMLAAPCFAQGGDYAGKAMPLLCIAVKMQDPARRFFDQAQ